MINKRILLVILAFLLIPLHCLTAFAEKTVDDEDCFLPCELSAPEPMQGYLGHLSDNNYHTHVTIKQKESIEIHLTTGEDFTGLFLDFYKPARNLEILYLDHERNTVFREFFADTDYLLSVEKPQIGDSAIASIVLKPTSQEISFNEVRVYRGSFSMPFPDARTTADVLVVLNKPGDELEKLGGLLALLAGEHNLSVQVLYLTKTDDMRAHQCMEALSMLGVRRMPVFGEAKETDSRRIDTVYTVLGGRSAVIQKLVEYIRTLRPSLVLSLDSAKAQERFTDSVITQILSDAVGMAADPQKYRDTDSFTVPKYYSLAADGETVIDLNVPLITYSGQTASEIAQKAYAGYTEERVYRRVLPVALRYSLLHTSVGPDEAHDDLLEHLDSSYFFAYANPTPTPTFTPEPTEEPSPTPSPTAAPTAAPSPTPAAQQAETMQSEEPDQTDSEADSSTTVLDRERSTALKWLLIGIGAVLFGGSGVYFAAKKRWNYALVCAVICICLAVLLGKWFKSSNQEPDPSDLVLPTEEPDNTAEPTPTVEPDNTAEPTPTAEPENTAEPTPYLTPTPVATSTATPSPEPTATPDPEAVFYLDYDGEEYVSDFTNRRWWYKSNNLSIDIIRVDTTYRTPKEPLVYFVADIHMRDGDSFRSGIHRFEPPWKYARYEKAVLAITGDNLIEAEKELKGCLIRKGEFYCDYGKADTLVIEPDNLTLSIRHPKQFSARELLDYGIRNTYSFGPTLIEDGIIPSDLESSRISHPNPRCGIGMVEPGHWIAIVTDGRQIDYSMSISLEYFAGLFQQYNCVIAYNLDGGASAGMVFMGEELNQHAMSRTDMQRPWFDSIMFGYSQNVPSPDIPTKHNGYHYE